MTEEQLWTEFCKKSGIDKNTEYDVRSFGDDFKTADILADLVVNGIKFGEARTCDNYISKDAHYKLPQQGDYSVVIAGNGEAVCVIRDYDVYICPFREVPHFHAYSEGEGDRSLVYWRNVHRKAFAECGRRTGIPFSAESLVVCEKFSVEYLPQNSLINSGEELLFVEATFDYADEIAAYRREMIDADSEFDGCFSLKRMPNIKEYADYCIGWANPARETDERGARGTVILCIRKKDMKMVGCLQVHHELNEKMANYTGHVGYSVRPSERRKGYATRMLAKAKDYLSSFGFQEITVSCMPGNEASRRTIKANGGEYMETVYLKDDDIDLERYRIAL
ncbi:GNAT family N-acetyltransferase [Butyrivibrio sp. MC2013]|uniref:GNAT family N-acetyltransferase n=1 Tax=Butyrivibrio sp. MC2013 TaxID=1280686 RepID=UPI000417A5F6|nr:GNAT family N-acetyltransferase [Butyrivibrio sp. MC2013]